MTAKAGVFVRFRAGKRIEIPGPYHRETWERIVKVVSDIAEAVITKAS